MQLKRFKLHWLPENRFSPPPLPLVLKNKLKGSKERVREPEKECLLILQLVIINSLFQSIITHFSEPSDNVPK